MSRSATARPETAGAPAPRYLVAVGLLTAAVAGALVGTALTLGAPVRGVVLPGVGLEFGLTLARVVMDISAVLTVGLSMLPLLIGVDRLAGAERTLAATRPVAAGSALVWAVSALVSLALLSVEYNPGSSLSLAGIGTYVGNVGSGQAVVIVAGFALLHALLGLVAIQRGERVPAELRTALALFTLLPLPVTGHAADTAPAMHDVSMVAMELHVLGAVAWTGGLLAVVCTLPSSRSMLSTTLPRFSRLATLSLLLVAATGVFMGWFILYETPGVQWFSALFTTGYGQVLIGKTLCIVGLAALGGRIRLKLLPLIVRHQKTGLVTLAGFELTTMGLAFGLAVVLTRAPVVT
jgi:putative copper resistance protein D